MFKKALRKRVSRGVYIEHGECFLEVIQTEMYTQFVEAHPEFKIGLRSFERCKPWFESVTHVAVDTIWTFDYSMMCFV